MKLGPEGDQAVEVAEAAGGIDEAAEKEAARANAVCTAVQLAHKAHDSRGSI
jgi:hypothetical protein